MTNIFCPSCGAILQIEIKEVKPEERISDMTASDILSRLPSRDSLTVNFEGVWAIVSLKKKISMKQFGKLNSEVRGYGGQYVKGYFKIPLAGITQKVDGEN